MDKADKMKGIVIRGEGVAKNFNYPTANIDIDLKKFNIVSGVYAGKIKFGDTVYKAAVAVKEEVNKFEAYLFDYSGEELYGQEAEILFLEKTGEIQVLPEKELKKKIQNDVQNIKKILNIK